MPAICRVCRVCGNNHRGKKRTGPICAKHPPGRSGKLDLSPFPSGASRQEGENVDYRHVEKLFDMLAEYFHNKPPPEEHDGRGEWVRVRDGLQGAEHCIRVLTPTEFEEWHRCIEMPIQVEFGLQAGRLLQPRRLLVGHLRRYRRERSDRRVRAVLRRTAGRSRQPEAGSTSVIRSRSVDSTACRSCWLGGHLRRRGSAWPTIRAGRVHHQPAGFHQRLSPASRSAL